MPVEGIEQEQEQEEVKQNGMSAEGLQGKLAQRLDEEANRQPASQVGR